MYPPRAGLLCLGGDYNPEQWSSDVWREDVALMREARVNLVTVGVFSWARLNPAPGRYDFGWLDEVLDLLAGHGIAADLATATASPPPWFSRAYPDSLPVDQDGRRLTYGSRQAYCPSSPAYRAAAIELVEQLAGRYGEHPALAMWHVNNEYGCHVPRCYCDRSATAFRDWLRERYASLEALNDAWGTDFWSQRYGDWAEILPPRATPAFHNPGQELDFRRFSSDALLALYRSERDVLKRHTPAIPVTTNLMAALRTDLDYWRWAPELDVVSNDHYLTAADPESQIDVAFASDLTRGYAGGPWLLMEHSTSAVNWQPRNAAKTPGQLLRNSIGHVARGSEGVMYFQWRAARAGSEKWHSAMLPHAGTDTKIWREVCELGAALDRLGEVAGSTVDADVAVVFDYASGWAQEAPSQPSVDMTCFAELRRWHATLWRSGITTDFAHPAQDLSRYRLVLVPALYLVSDATAANLKSYVDGGGTVLVGAYSGIVDEYDRARLGGYPGAFADLLGIRVEEFFPLLSGQHVALSDGGTGTIWAERGRATTATVLATHLDPPVPGCPALTRNRYGTGTAWYLGTRLPEPDLARLIRDVSEQAGVRPVLLGGNALGPDVEAVRRRHPDGTSYLFLLNHGDHTIRVPATGTDMLTGDEIGSILTLPAGGVAVLRAKEE
ncbi:MAG TPA: beta-galactosidase [Rugosimonospora sp.]|nr:beta-galactosidase [Rugosimonospora sp.]